jgi:hypothetical protein
LRVGWIDMRLSRIGANIGTCVRRYLRSESGVVTVEWVAIAAGVTIGAIYISYIVMHGLVAPANHIASQLSPS